MLYSTQPSLFKFFVTSFLESKCYNKVAIAEFFKKTAVKSKNNCENNGYFLEKIQNQKSCIILFLHYIVDHAKGKRAKKLLQTRVIPARITPILNIARDAPY